MKKLFIDILESKEYGYSNVEIIGMNKSFGDSYNIEVQFLHDGSKKDYTTSIIDVWVALMYMNNK